MVAMIAAIFVVCLAGGGLGCFIYITVSYREPLTNATLYRLQWTQFYANNQGVVDFVFQTIFSVTVPTLSLSVVMAATIIIAIRMRATLAWRLKASNVRILN